MNSSCNNSKSTLRGACKTDVVSSDKIISVAANTTTFLPVDSIYEAASTNVTAKCATASKSNATPAAPGVDNVQAMIPDSFSGNLASFNASEAVTECMAAVGGVLRERIAINGTSLGSQKIIFKGTDVELPLLFTLLIATVYFYAWVFHDGNGKNSAQGRYHAVAVRTIKRTRKRRRHKSKERFQHGNASKTLQQD